MCTCQGEIEFFGDFQRWNGSLQTYQRRSSIRQSILRFPVDNGEKKYYIILRSIKSSQEMSANKKPEVITFKADAALSKALARIENRSAFIRQAVLSALQANCPLCQGTGVLTREQQKHWSSFSRSHSLQECPECHALHLVCSAAEDMSAEKENEST